MLGVSDERWAALERENERLERRLKGAELEAAALARLMPLCACDFNPATTDGPQRECPVHGDGETFVIHVQRLEAVAQAAWRMVGPGAIDDPVQAAVALSAALEKL